MQNLRSKLIRLAHQKPSLRADLLPLLAPQGKQAALGLGRTFFQRKLEKSTGGKHFPNYEGLDVEAFWFPYEGTPKGLGAIFIGKQDKPVSYYNWPNLEGFQKELDQYASNRKFYFAQKAKQKQERADYKHDYVVGDILSSSWGYDQTNVDFYQVLAVAGKAVTLREVASKTVRQEHGADYVVAVPGHFTGPPMKRLVQEGGRVKINDSERAYKWDGKPQYETASGYGH